ncbi:unnamed protein product [Brassica oleracea var. botrytis]
MTTMMEKKSLVERTYTSSNSTVTRLHNIGTAFTVWEWVFAAIHDDLRSDAILELADELEWRLSLFLAPHLNRYALTWKFLDDEVIKSPKSLYGHDYTMHFDGSRKNCRLFRICSNIAHML